MSPRHTIKSRLRQKHPLLASAHFSLNFDIMVTPFSEEIKFIDQFIKYIKNENKIVKLFSNLHSTVYSKDHCWIFRTRGSWTTMAHLSEQFKTLNSIFKPLSCHGNKSKWVISHNFMLGGRLLNTNSRKCLLKYLQWEIKFSFHFSHYKSMETLSCHSNQSKYATAKKKKNKKKQLVCRG